MTCDMLDCDKPAEWSVAVLLFPPKPFTGMPARREYPHKLCTAHTQVVTVRDFVDDEQWVDIVRTYKAKKRKIPDWERCQLAFKKVREPLKLVTNGPA